MTERHRHTQDVAALRSGMSARTARRLEQDPRLPSQRPRARPRTVADPLAGIWVEELEPMLERHPGLKPVTLLRYLQRNYPQRFPDDGIRRTLERRVRTWLAHHGPDKDVIFRQQPSPGRMALSDFTDANGLGVTIDGAQLDHRLYHFVLAYSRWEHVAPVLGGESFAALAENLQAALWQLGGVPAEHRSDSLSAAFKNLDATATADITDRYEAFCRHYGMTASRNNPGEAHENGAVEAHHRHLKTALEQALVLRGSRDFPDLAAYRRFIDTLVAERNRRRSDGLRAELPTLKALPAYRTTDYEETVATVTRTGGFTVKNVFYSAPSRLIGQRLRVHVYDARIEAYLGGTHVVSHPRLPRTSGNQQKRRHVVDYRHVLPALRRKPQALASSIYRDSLFPRSEYRRAWEALLAQLDQKTACRRMVGLLSLAFDENCEARLARHLDAILAAGELPEIDALRQAMRDNQPTFPASSDVILTEPSAYDSLLTRSREAAV